MIKRVFLLLTAIININNCMNNYMEENSFSNNDQLTIGFGMFFAYVININKNNYDFHYELLECVNNKRACDIECIEYEKKEEAILAIGELKPIDKSGIAYSVSSDRSILILDRIKIKKKCQGKGLGTRVLRELIIEFFSQDEAEKILVCYPIVEAVNFYKNLGFREFEPYIIGYGIFGNPLQMTRRDYNQKYNF